MKKPLSVSQINNWDKMRANGWRVSYRCRWRISATHPSGARFDFCRFAGDVLQASLSCKPAGMPLMSCNARVHFNGRTTHEWQKIEKALPTFEASKFEYQYMVQ